MINPATDDRTGGGGVQVALFLLGIFSSFIFFLFVLLGPSVFSDPVVLPDHPMFFLVPDRWIQTFLMGLSLLIPALSAWGFCRIQRNHRTVWMKAILPLGFLPLSSTLLLLAMPPITLASTALLLFPAGLLCVSFCIAMNGLQPAIDTLHPRWIMLGIVLFFTVFYTITGTYFNDRFGEVEVDEGHYLIQAASLIQDGDLDIKNNLDLDLDAAIAQFINDHPKANSGVDLYPEAVAFFRKHFHVSHNSPEGKWYSWHPFGLSLLIAPTVPIGLWSRQLVLALISALSLAITFRLSTRLGNTQTSSLWLVLITGLTVFWIVFSIRSLPEVLGAGLIVACYYGAVLFKEKPKTAVAVFLPSILFMPFAHPRFLLYGGTACIYFALTIFIQSNRKKRLLKIAVGLTVATGVVLGIFYIIYDGAFTSYPIRGIFFVYPEGAWLAMFSDRGYFYGFPLSAFCIIATGFALYENRSKWLIYSLFLFAFLLHMILFTTLDNWDGGPTMAGRYALAMTLMFIPGGAWVLNRLPFHAKWWVTFIPMVSFYMFIWSITHLSRVDIWWLNDPLLTLRSTIPAFRMAFDPFGSGTPVISMAFLITLTLFYFTLCSPRLNKTSASLVATAIFIGIAVFSDAKSDRPVIKDINPAGVDWLLSRMHSPRATISSPSDKKHTPLFEIADRFYPHRLPITLVVENPETPVNVVHPFVPVTRRAAYLNIKGTVESGQTPTLRFLQHGQLLHTIVLDTSDSPQVDETYVLEHMDPEVPLHIELGTTAEAITFSLEDIAWAPHFPAVWIDLPEAQPIDLKRRR